MQGVNLRKYGVEAKIDFELYEVDGISLKTDAASATGDINIMRDEANEEQLDADAFVDEGMGYSLVLSIAEITAARVVVYIIDQTSPKVWLDKVIVVETYGNASAQHALDLDSATVTLADGGLTATKIGTDAITNAKIADEAIAVENIKDAAISAAKLATGAITAAKIAADAVTAAKVAADVHAEAADAVWDEVSTGHVSAGKAGQQLWTDVDAVLADTNELQTDDIPGTLFLIKSIIDVLPDGGALDDLAAILADTGTDGVIVNDFTTAAKALLQTEANDALVAQNLDHLAKTATAAADMTAEVADNTILSRMLASGDTSVFVPATDSLQDIRDALCGAGAGLPTATITVKDTIAGGAVVAGVTVQIYDSTNTTRVNQGLTAATGIVAIIVPADGTYKVRLYKDGWTQSTVPETLTVADGVGTDEYYMTEFTPTAPSGSTTTTLYGTIRTGSAVDYSGQIVTARLAQPAFFEANDVGISTNEVSAATNSSGYFELTLVRNATYKITCDALDVKDRLVEVTAATVDLEAALRG